MAEPFEVTLDRLDGYRFEVDFQLPGVPALVTDEAPPLGAGAGPNPARLLAAAVANCLGASLLFCLNKARVPVTDLKVRAEGQFARNERGRLRIEGLNVVLEPHLAEAVPAGFARCLGIFEDFCIVTQSVKEGIDVEVTVRAVEPEPA